MARELDNMSIVRRQPGLFSLCALLTFLLAAWATDSLISKARAENSGSFQGREQSTQTPAILIPLRTISGGQLAARVDLNGFPASGAMQGYLSLVSPSALAVRGSDLYVADSGSRKLIRIDTITQVMAVVPGVDAMTWTRMQVGADLSLYVLDSTRARILHFTRGLQPLQTLGDSSASLSLDGFAIDEFLGNIIASDRLGQRLVMFSSIGGPAAPLNLFSSGFVPSLVELTSAGRTVYAIDRACPCIAAIYNQGNTVERIGEGLLQQPRSLAADRHGRIFVSDATDRSLKIFLRGDLVASLSAQKLGVTELSALAVDEDVLYIADGPGSKVLSFRIRMP